MMATCSVYRIYIRNVHRLYANGSCMGELRIRPPLMTIWGSYLSALLGRREIFTCLRKRLQGVCSLWKQLIILYTTTRPSGYSGTLLSLCIDKFVNFTVFFYGIVIRKISAVIFHMKMKKNYVIPNNHTSSLRTVWQLKSFFYLLTFGRIHVWYIHMFMMVHTTLSTICNRHWATTVAWPGAPEWKWTVTAGEQKTDFLCMRALHTLLPSPSRFYTHIVMNSWFLHAFPCCIFL